MDTIALEYKSTGVAGLDEILHGGFLSDRVYLVRGGPGTGKTTIGLHFLTAGQAIGEKSLFITLEETETKIRENGVRMGFDMRDIAFLDLSPTSEYFSKSETYDIFSPAEVEREPMTKRIIESVQTIRPVRVFLDPLTQFRYLSGDLFQFRKQVLSFLRFLTEQNATVLFTSESSPEAPDDDFQFMADGIVQLEYPPSGRALCVKKTRGSDFKKGIHSIRLSGTGMAVFPRLVPEKFWKKYSPGAVSSGIPELDELLHGGVERGTVTVVTGPSGSGKTTLGLQFMKEAAGRGERSVVYSFDEATKIIVDRCESINIPARIMMEQGILGIVKIEPLQYSPDEFAQIVRVEVEQKNAQLIMIDSVAGYALANERGDMKSQLHGLCKYLQHMGVAVFVIAETSGTMGTLRVSDIGISYLADNVVFFRYLEMNGELHKAIGVLKKRLSSFERTLREFEITRYGIRVGKPLTGLRGILSGMPVWSGPGTTEA